MSANDPRRTFAASRACRLFVGSLMASSPRFQTNLYSRNAKRLSVPPGKAQTGQDQCDCRYDSTPIGSAVPGSAYRCVTFNDKPVRLGPGEGPIIGRPLIGMTPTCTLCSALFGLGSVSK